MARSHYINDYSTAVKLTAVGLTNPIHPAQVEGGHAAVEVNLTPTPKPVAVKLTVTDQHVPDLALLGTDAKQLQLKGV